MASIVTGIIGGFQGSSAAHNAANAQAGAYTQAGNTVVNAAADANPQITNAAQQAGTGATNAAAMAGGGATAAGANASGLLNAYTQAGNTAADQLNTDAGANGLINQQFSGVDLNTDPGYEFRMQQGQQALERSEAASGGAQGGAAMKAITRYGQDYASNEYQNAFNRFLAGKQATIADLSGIAGQGQTAAATQGSQGIQTAEYAGSAATQAAQYAGTAGMHAADLTASNTINAADQQAKYQAGVGDAKARGDIGAASAWNNALSGIGSGIDSAISGGFGGDAGGFSMMGAVTGDPSWNMSTGSEESPNAGYNG